MRSPAGLHHRSLYTEHVAGAALRASRSMEELLRDTLRMEESCFSIWKKTEKTTHAGAEGETPKRGLYHRMALSSEACNCPSDVKQKSRAHSLFGIWTVSLVMFLPVSRWGSSQAMCSPLPLLREGSSQVALDCLPLTVC